MKIARLFLILLTVCLTITAAFLGRGSLASGSTHGVVSPAEAQTSSERGPVRMIRFVVSADGLYPRYMRVDQGLVNIALEDKTRGSGGLVIESVQGFKRSEITQVSRAENNLRGRVLVPLIPGRYLVSDASQPGHQAELIVSR